MKTLKYINSFVKNECANYDGHYKGCSFCNKKAPDNQGGEVCPDRDCSACADLPRLKLYSYCKVEQGERCGYFERAVLGPVDYKYRLPGHDYQKLFAQYAELTKTDTLAVVQRNCDCGNPLRLRQRFCDACSRKRRKASNRKYNRKRAGSTTTVN